MHMDGAKGMATIEARIHGFKSDFMAMVCVFLGFVPEKDSVQVEFKKCSYALKLD
jgi:hypothetical protein